MCFVIHKGTTSITVHNFLGFKNVNSRKMQMENDLESIILILSWMTLDIILRQINLHIFIINTLKME